MTGDPSSELQQYLHFEGHPSVGMSITWKGFFMYLDFSCEGKRITKRRERGLSTKNWAVIEWV
jgi:hypothetical protein